MQKRTLYIILGAIAVIVIGSGIGIFVLAAITSASAQVTATPTPPPVATKTASKGNGIAKILRQYAPDIKSQVAQGLRLTPDQLTAQLKAGKTLPDIAVAQGIPSTQLQTIIKNALENALKAAIDHGDMTQVQLDRQVKRFTADPTLLDRLLGGGSKGTKQVTPSPAPAQ
jgi:hypothetical protein